MNSREYFPIKTEGSSPQAGKTSKRPYNGGGSKALYKKKYSPKHSQAKRQWEPKQSSSNHCSDHSDDTLESSTGIGSSPQGKTTSAIIINSEGSDTKMLLVSEGSTSKFSEY